MTRTHPGTHMQLPHNTWLETHGLTGSKRNSVSEAPSLIHVDRDAPQLNSVYEAMSRSTPGQGLI